MGVGRSCGLLFKNLECLPWGNKKGRKTLAVFRPYIYL